MGLHVMNLKNLKAGQTRTTELEGVEVAVTKIEGGYTLTAAGETAGLRYDKDAKSWQLVLNQVAYDLDASAETAVAVARALWVKLAAAEAEVAGQTGGEEPADEGGEPEVADETLQRKMDQILAAIKLAQDERGDQHQAEAALAMVAKLMDKYSITQEQLRRRDAELRGEEAAPEGIVSWEYPVNVQGGHALHRVAAFTSVATAMGAGVFYVHHKPKGAGYKFHTVTLHVFAQPSVVENLKTFLPLVELQMERLAERVSKEVSRASRLTGGHHSGPGCHARRGFMRGFGAGVASRIRQDKQTAGGDTSTALVLRDRASEVEEYMATNHADLKTVKPQKYDQGAWHQGHEAGVAFASPQVTAEAPAERVLQHA